MSGQTAADIAEHLKQEEEWLNTLTNSLHWSEQLKERMLSTLTSFEQRLSNLEATVLPLYEHTGMLQQRQQNIAKTMKTLDSMLGFYRVASEVDATIRDCDPRDDLDKYLQHMSKLQEAIQFFELDKQADTQLNNVRASYDFGCGALERELKEQLRKTSIPLRPVVILDAISDNYEIVTDKISKIELVPAVAQQTLSKLTQWLWMNVESGASNALLCYGDTRGVAVLRALQSIQEHMRTQMNMLTGYGSVSKQSPMPARKDGTPPRPIGALQKRARQYAVDPNFRRATLAVEHVTKEMSLENDAETFVLVITAYIGLLHAELALMRKIFGVNAPRDVLARQERLLTQRSAQYVLELGEALLAQIRKSMARNDHAAMLCLFPVSKHFHQNEKPFDIFLKHYTAEQRVKFHELQTSTNMLCIKGMEDFVEHVKSDQDKFVPKDGTVHQLTSNALIFLEQLMEVKDCLSLILSDGVSENAPGVVPKYFARVLSALGLNLSNKAEFYSTTTTSDAALKAVFLLNNYNHIYKTLQKTGMMKVVCEQNREVEGYYQEQIKLYRNQYLDCWSKVASTLAEHGGSSSPLIGQKLKDKERDVIKAGFAAFNKDFETLSTAQRTFSVPDLELAQALKKECKAVVVPRYQTFFNKYHTANFSKNPEKYLRYTPLDVSAMIDKLFDSQA